MKQIKLSVTVSHQRKIHLSNHQLQVLWGRRRRRRRRRRKRRRRGRRRRRRRRRVSVF